MQNNFLQLLHEQHEQVKGMFGGLQGGGGDFNELRRALESHMRGEEVAFYPVLMQASETPASSQQAISQHRTAQSVLKELTGMSPGGAGWMDKINQLQDAILKHVQYEESRLFPEASKVISKKQFEEMQKSFQAEAERAKASIT